MFLAGGFLLLAPADSARTEAVPFVVSRGDGLKEIAGRLKGEGLIKSKIGFTIYSLITGAATGFKPGTYSLAKSMGVSALARTLEAGIPAITVTIKEGMTLVDISRIMADKGITRPGELEEYDRGQDPSLEGYLFPDTYTFSAGTSAASVVAVMRKNFDRYVGPLLVGLTEAEIRKTVILASLVEKEALYPHDRLLAAGVFVHRLAIGMPLQVDAANIYVKCKGAYITCPSEDRELTKADLAAESPYNLYLHAGLPPGPIANAGKDAFVSALHPERTRDLYYISNPLNGKLIFAETLEGHNKNRAKYHIN